VTDAWATDELLASAVQRFAVGIPGFALPVAYGVARVNCDMVTLAHVNPLGAVRPLPAVVLASVCGYVDGSGNFALTREQLRDAVHRLTPAEAATHVPHPNLWTWRTLLADAQPDSAFHAYFLAEASDLIDGPGSVEFAEKALA
jgi:hypothetical protein